jgi:hypothetical protein
MQGMFNQFSLYRNTSLSAGTIPVASTPEAK